MRRLFFFFKKVRKFIMKTVQTSRPIIFILTKGMLEDVLRKLEFQGKKRIKKSAG